MALTNVEKAKVVETYQHKKGDTGSVEVQVALLTHNIKQITEHFKVHKKDLHSRRGLLTMVNKRRRLLKYLKRSNLERFIKLVESLQIRH